MNPERVQTTLRFIGGWPWWAGLLLALALGAAAWLLYRRETQPLRRWLNFLLPALRVLAVVLIVLMLSGPILHHRKTIGQLSRLWLFVDGSQSMELTDPSMDAGRKIAILQRLGLLREDAVKMDLPRATAALTEVQALAESGRNFKSAPVEQWKTLLSSFSSKIGEAQSAISSAVEPPRAESFRRDLSDPARELAARPAERVDDRVRAIGDLLRLGEAAKRWAGELRESFERGIREQAANEQSPLGSAIAKFNTMPRWQRLQAELLTGEGAPLLAKLGERHDVQLLALDGGAARKIWQPTGADSALPAALPKPAGEITNLATGLKNAATDQEKSARAALVLFTDGQHNEGESPVEVAKILAGRGVPIFTVGFGAETRPRDLAVVKVDAPDAVFFEDRVRGQIVLKDDMPAGQPFTVTIKDGDKTVWQQALVTDGQNLRRVAFDFPISDIVKERLRRQQSEQKISGVPVELGVAVSHVEGDSQPANDRASLRLRAVTQRRRILLLDGSSRWESRYLRNLFERDEQWEINAVISGATADAGWPRGDRDGTFPNEPALLASYDLIVFGEVPRTIFKDDELQMIQDFVGKRGGAIVFIDGPRGRLKEFDGTPLAPLFPVEWRGDGVRDGITRLALTDRGAGIAALSLAADRAQNADIWQGLRPPHWIAGATPLPGAETLVEADANGKKMPAAVYRPFGAGKVFYHAFEDSWRWRYEVADLYHVRYWNQIANWVAELPFAVRDKFISLDAGAVTYRPGDSADLRVRLRDGENKPVTNATVDAVLYRDGTRAATIRLTPDENAGGLFRGKTAALEPGSYEVAVESIAIPANELKARAEFKVEPRETGELTQLSLNEALLRQMSATSGGQYLR
ncbi:MAG TPA: VWA domain-containing protein, partial [Chthoniobacteraceae bacterium]|nr:VWA domain-containing protein [Chthoniobacteraceae bacterium]